MAQSVFGSWSMVQLSLRLQRVTKTKQWETFQRVMLVIVLLIWLTTMITSMFLSLSVEREIGGTSTGASAATGPSLFHSRKLAWVDR